MQYSVSLVQDLRFKRTTYLIVSTLSHFTSAWTEDWAHERQGSLGFIWYSVSHTWYPALFHSLLCSDLLTSEKWSLTTLSWLHVTSWTEQPDQKEKCKVHLHSLAFFTEAWNISYAYFHAFCLFVCFVFNWEDKFAKEHFKPFILLAPIGVRLLKQTLLPDSSGDAAIKFKSLSFVCFFFLNQWRLGTSPTLILLKARGWQKKLHFDWESVHASIRPRIWDQHRRCRTERF